MIKAIIFDLDDTLYDCTGTLTPIGERLACEKVIPLLGKLGIETTIGKCLEARQRLFPEHGPSFRPVSEAMLREFGVKDEKDIKELHEVMYKAYHSIHIEGIEVFPGVYELLEELKKSFRLFLITGGDPELQKTKIDFLKLTDYFESIHYHDTFGEGLQTKKDYFNYVVDQTGFSAEEILVVGDRLDLEIEIAKELGMKTARVNFGKYSNLTGYEEADFVIDKVTDIKDVLAKL